MTTDESRIEQLEIQVSDLKKYAISKGIESEIKDYDKALPRLIKDKEYHLTDEYKAMKLANETKWAMEYD